jgi:rSAM/selenodomain-associated transferase 2
VKITVIIPALNEARTIAETLRHTATLGFDEILVVDGGSSDQTCSLVESYNSSAQHSALGTIRLLPSYPGRARQMNEAAKACSGDILLFLHADTSLPATARKAIEAALADTDIGGGRFDVEFDNTSRWSRTISFFMNTRSRFTRIATGDQGLFVRRTVFEQLGGFPDIPLMEDIEFSRRLKRHGATAALKEKVTTSFRRWERRGPLRTILLMWTLRFLYWIGVNPHRLQRYYAAIR